MKFSERLSKLGFDSYKSYLESDHWKEFRSRYLSSGMPRACRVCNSRRIELHHINYDRIGNEEFSDIMPLCAGHHEQVHAKLKSAKKPVSETAWAIQFLDPTRPRLPKRKRKQKRNAWKKPRKAQVVEQEKIHAVHVASVARFKKSQEEAKEKAKASMQEYQKEARNDPMRMVAAGIRPGRAAFQETVNRRSRDKKKRG